MTIAEAQQALKDATNMVATLSELFNQPTPIKEQSEKVLIGKHVIVRARDASPFFGVLEDYEGRVVTLSNARRIYRYWSGGDEITLSGVALHGMDEKRTEPKMTSAVKTVVIQDACEILECSDVAAKKLEAYRVATQD
jgi:hypothetical protein